MGKGIVKLGEGQWAVKDGNLLAAKETNGRFKNAEFTVARGTRATYVGRDGLIKESNLQDTNLVQNGDFEELGDELVPSIVTTENNNGGVINYISGNSYSSSSDGTSTSIIRPKLDFNTTSGETYKLVITPTGTITGTVNFDFYDGSSYLLQNYDFTTTKEIYFTDNGNVFGAFDGQQTYSIDSFTISVKEVGQDWTFANDANMGDNVATIIGDGSAAGYIIQDNVFESNKVYKCVFDVTINSGLGLKFQDGLSYSPHNENIGFATTSGVYTFYFNSTSYNQLAIVRRTGGTAYDSIINSVTVKEVKTDTPRIDFTDNTDGHLLLEPQSTNLYLNSEPTANEGIEANITYEPFAWDNGFTNCVRFVDNSSTTYRYGGTALANTTCTLSCYVIMDDLSKPIVSYGSLFGDNTNNSNFDFSFIIGGIINPVLEEDIKYEDCGNNIWKVSRKGLVGASSLNNNGIIKYTGQSSKGFRVVGWQLEALPYPTSYIPTNGSTVTRDGETCTGSGEAADFNSEEGVLYAEIAALSDVDGRWISLSNGTTNQRVSIAFQADDIRLYIKNASGLIWDYTYTSANIFNYNKIALKYKGGDYALWINGTEVSTDSNSNLLSGLNSLQFDSGGGSSDFYGKCKAIRVYKETDGIDLETLTSL